MIEPQIHHPSAIGRGIGNQQNIRASFLQGFCHIRLGRVRSDWAADTQPCNRVGARNWSGVEQCQFVSPEAIFQYPLSDLAIFENEIGIKKLFGFLPRRTDAERRTVTTIGGERFKMCFYLSQKSGLSE